MILVLLAGSATACEKMQPLDPRSQLPVLRMTIEVKADSRDEFLRIMSELASHNQLEHEVARVTPNGVYVIVEMLSDDFRIIVANDLEPEVFDLRAYESARHPFPRDRLEQFMAELRNALERVDGVRIRS